MARVHRIVVWVLIVLLVAMAVGHLVLTILFYAGMNQQGYGFLLDYRWPAWLIAILDVAAALALWVSIKRVEGTSPLGPALTFAAALYLVGRTAWTVVVPVLALVAVRAATMALQRPTPASQWFCAHGRAVATAQHAQRSPAAGAAQSGGSELGIASARRGRMRSGRAG